MMEENVHSEDERRVHYRLPIRGNENISAQINTSIGVISDIQPINLSSGGLLCRLKTDQKMSNKLLSSLETVTLQLSNKGCVSVEGHIRRLEYTGGDNYYYCAIQFTGMRENSIKKPDTQAAKDTIPLSKGFLTDPIISLKQTPNYMKVSDPVEAAGTRNKVYSIFERIVNGLKPEDQWWFYEVLDVLKAQEPHYSPGLIAEYTRLFKKGRSTSDYHVYHSDTKH